MTNAQRDKVNSWLSERKAVYERLATKLGAVYDLAKHTWMINDKTFGDSPDNWVELTDSSMRDSFDAVQLIVNHAYYMGCVDGVHAIVFGVD